MSAIYRIEIDSMLRNTHYRWEEDIQDFINEMESKHIKILNMACYATLYELIKDDDVYKSEHYSDGECLDWIFTILHDLGLDADFEHVKKKIPKGSIAVAKNA